jgi:hypothetical protein
MFAYINFVEILVLMLKTHDSILKHNDHGLAHSEVLEKDLIYPISEFEFL